VLDYDACSVESSGRVFHAKYPEAAGSRGTDLCDSYAKDRL
jgi:hypothetical protein